MGQIASRSQLRWSFARWALVLVPLVLLLGFLSGRVAGSGSGNAWFAALRKPAIMPPDAAFGVVWSLIYVLIGLAAAVVANARGSRLRGIALALFVVQLALNLAWSPLFFAMHQVTLAFWWLLALIVVVTATAWTFLRVRPIAGALMLPYLAWLVFAAALNQRYDALNPNAEALAPDASSTQITF